MSTGLKDPMRALRIHSRLAVPFYLNKCRCHSEKYIKRAHDKAAESYNLIGNMIAADIDQSYDVEAIKTASSNYKTKWLTNQDLALEFREAIKQHVRDLDALAIAVGGGWSERMFPMFADNDR